MRSNVKFYRKVNIRTRSSDRRLFWYAVAVAVTAHVVFLGAFDYRRRARQSGEGGSAVTLLSMSDLTKQEREGFRSWLEYHDPLNFGSGWACEDAVAGTLHDIPTRRQGRLYSEDAVDGTLHDVRPAELKSRLRADIPVGAAAGGEFSKVPGRKKVAPMVLPPPPPPRVAAKTAAIPASGMVTDGNGTVLPLGDVKLPHRTPGTTGQTVLRVYKSGGPPVLITERSCGDAQLDRIAAHKLLFLARGETAPEFIYVEWPEARK